MYDHTSPCYGIGSVDSSFAGGYCDSEANQNRQLTSITLPHPSWTLSDGSHIIGAIYGMLSTSMIPSHYQVLADRGWRRYQSLPFRFSFRNFSIAHCSIAIDPEHFTTNLIPASLAVLTTQFGMLDRLIQSESRLKFVGSTLLHFLRGKTRREHSTVGIIIS